jgi:hypothetical protein
MVMNGLSGTKSVMVGLTSDISSNGEGTVEVMVMMMMAEEVA